MVSYTCAECNGRGWELVTTIRRGEVKQTKEQCISCFGSGSMRNGNPEYFHSRYDELWSDYE